MILVGAIAFGVVFAAGVYLMMHPHAARVVGGLVLLSNAGVLLVMLVGIGGDVAPIHPVSPGRAADPLVQALTLTALVISVATTALAVALVYRVERAHGSGSARELARAEVEDAGERGAEDV